LATTDPAGIPGYEEVQLAVARVLVEGTSAETCHRGIPLLDQVVNRSDDMGLDGIRIEALALRAIALYRCGDPAGALTDLEAALRLGEAEGYVRRFVDLGSSMQQVLREANRRQVMPGYVASLLAAFSEDRPWPGPSLPEPLSAREREVLHLLAAGLSNREIGARLSISPETVKKHTASIYGKLGVRGRVEAVTRARSLALID
jgi:LuxR family maltose regulon positive regulatory protein